MHISIATVFPELYGPFLHTSLIKRAQEAQIVSIGVDSFFSCVSPKERIDAPIFGAGAGMLIKPEVFETLITRQENTHGKAFKIFFSPQGKTMDQTVMAQVAHEFQKHRHLLLVASRYEGIDERVQEEYADLVLSAGDFVLMGGDLPVMMLLEGMLRLIPGVVGRQESVAHDSFTGPFVDYPTYTEPVEWRGHRVPDIVRSGNHGALNTWRLQKAIRKTVTYHFNWLKTHPTTPSERIKVESEIPPHYVVLAHSDVMIASEGTTKVGTTSVTSIDLHDIARSSRTFGVKEFLVVTPLVDQQKIVQKLVSFWATKGEAYNANRHDAIKLISIHSSLEAAIAYVGAKHEVPPLVVTTTARVPTAGTDQQRLITYYDQARVFGHGRPVMLIFGTGQGLRQEVLDASDFQLLPVEGFTDFNHLSVRSAVAIILDRWLGISYKQLPSL